jgi:hypothetical protein
MIWPLRNLLAKNQENWWWVACHKCCFSVFVDVVSHTSKIKTECAEGLFCICFKIRAHFPLSQQSFVFIAKRLIYIWELPIIIAIYDIHKIQRTYNYNIHLLCRNTTINYYKMNKPKWVSSYIQLNIFRNT